MRVLAALLACLACTGYGRRTRTAGQGPVYQAGLSGQVGAPTSRDSLASLLGMRGGYSGFDDGYERRGRFGGGYRRRGWSGLDDVRGGYLGSLPMTSSRSRESFRSRRDVFDVEDLDDFRAMDTRRFTRGSGSRLSRGMGRSDTALVQGQSLKTWSFPSSSVDRVQVELTTDGRPLDADVQLWQGPDNTPCKMRVYSEDGAERPFQAVIATPDTSGGDKTIAIRNVAQLEFPLNAYVTAREVDEPLYDFRETSVIVQGGSLRTFNFDTEVESVEIMLQTDGRPLNARIELLQGPNNNKQVIELYTEDGLERPFFAVIDTMGSGNVVRVVNTAPIEFPMTAMVQPHTVDEKMSLTDPVIQ